LLNDCGELPMNKTTPQINKFILKSPARNDAKVDPNECSMFRCVCRSGTAWGDGMTEKVVWHVVKTYALVRKPSHGVRVSRLKLKTGTGFANGTRSPHRSCLQRHSLFLS